MILDLPTHLAGKILQHCRPHEQSALAATCQSLRREVALNVGLQVHQHRLAHALEQLAGLGRPLGPQTQGNAPTVHQVLAAHRPYLGYTTFLGLREHVDARQVTAFAGCLPQLDTLVMHVPQSGEVDAQLADFVGLRRLTLVRAQRGFMGLPPQMQNLRQLTALRLINVDLPMLPEWLLSLDKLTSLDVEGQVWRPPADWQARRPNLSVHISCGTHQWCTVGGTLYQTDARHSRVLMWNSIFL